DAERRFTLLLPEISAEAAHARLEQLSQRIASHAFVVGGEPVRLTPAIGYVVFTAEAEAAELYRQAALALDRAISQLDLHPRRFGPALAGAHGPDAPPSRPWKNLLEALRIPFQIAVTLFVGLVFPVLIYAAWGATIVNIAPAAYLAAVVAMLVTAVLITI